MGSATINLNAVDQLTGGRLGTFDIACPWCGRQRRAAVNQRRRVLRVWHVETGYVTYHCVRCGEHGCVRNTATVRRPLDRAAVVRAQAEAVERERVAAEERLAKARRLWSARQPIANSIAERYLRQARGYGGPLPATLGFLASRGYPPAMIAAFGIAREAEPGIIAINDDAVRGVHLTRLVLDGDDRERGERAKIMIGRSAGFPIVLAPPTDLLGLVITEGIEDALIVHEATGLGAWAAGCASRMPALLHSIPAHIECVTVVGDDDDDGRCNAIQLTEKVGARGIEARLFIPHEAK